MGQEILVHSLAGFSASGCNQGAAGVVVNSRLDREGFALKVTYVIVVRIQFLAGCWIEMPSVLGVWVSPLGQLTWEVELSEPERESQEMEVIVFYT